jgi:hypothetical protein
LHCIPEFFDERSCCIGVRYVQGDDQAMVRRDIDVGFGFY